MPSIWLKGVPKTQRDEVEHVTRESLGVEIFQDDKGGWCYRIEGKVHGTWSEPEPVESNVTSSVERAKLDWLVEKYGRCPKRTYYGRGSCDECIRPVLRDGFCGPHARGADKTKASGEALKSAMVEDDRRGKDLSRRAKILSERLGVDVSVYFNWAGKAGGSWTGDVVISADDLERIVDTLGERI